jgi:hypothetical protein
LDWITDTIAIGNFLEAEDAELLRKESINSILSLIGNLQGKSPDMLGVCRLEVIPLVDGPGNDPRRFRRCVDVLSELVSTAPPVLVHCQAGRSRSPIVVAGYLMRALKIDSDRALAMVTAKRETNIIPVLERLLDHIDVD